MYFYWLDESNWRNDYPDEDEDESSAYSNSSDDSDHIHHSHYRHREPYYGILILTHTLLHKFFF